MRNKEKSHSYSFYYSVIIFSALLLCILYKISNLREYNNQNNDINIIESMARVDVSTEIPVSYPHELFINEYSQVKSNGIYQTRLISDRNSISRESITLITDKDIQFPLNYTRMNFPLIPYPIYAFIGADGVIRYRVPVNKYSNNDRETGLVEAVLTMNGTSIQFEIDPNYQLIPLEAEPFAILKVVDAPAEKTSGLEKVYGRTGVYQTTHLGEKLYLCYGSYSSEEGKFYLADSNGNAYDGSFPIL